MAFPQDPLDVKVELQLAGVWTDVTGDVLLRDRIDITRGRADEAPRADPAKCTLTLNNAGGAYSRRNPLGPYYGRLTGNTPVRVSVPAGITYLHATGVDGDYISTPDSAALSIVGDIDIRVDVEPGSWFAETDLIGKWVSTGGQGSWGFYLRSDGRPQLYWSSNGSAFSTAQATAPVPVAGGRLAVRVTLDVDNGSGGWTCRFYTADTLSGSWTQLGAAVTGTGVTSIFDGSAPVRIGGIPTFTLDPLAGRVYAAQIRSGINGTIVASPDFTAQTAGAGSFVDGQGNTWTTAGAAAISDRAYRYHGEIPTWPPRWDLSGNDHWVSVEAAGITRRLGQGRSPLRSAMRRQLTDSTTGMIAYWPLEEPERATSFGSALPGGSPLTPISSDAPDAAAFSGFVGSAPIPTMQKAHLSAPVPTYPVTGQTQLRMLLAVPSGGPGGNRLLARLRTTGTATTWDLRYDQATGALNVTIYDVEGVQLASNTTVLFPSGRLLWVSLELTQDGANVDYGVVIYEQFGGQGSFNQYTLNNQTVGAVRQVGVGSTVGLGDTAIGHVTLYNTITDIFDLRDQINGYAGEKAAIRAARLCRENDIPLILIGDPSDSAPMGAQQVATLMDLLEDCAAADGGLLYEPPDRLALAFRTRASIYNQAATLTLDYSAPGEVSPPLEPVDDDQKTRNDITVQRQGGASVRTILEAGPLSVQPPPDGVGRYETSETINVARDEQLPDHAGWRLHLGTWDEARWPSVHVDLAAAPHLAGMVLGLDCRDRVTITNLPPVLPPGNVDLIAEGYAETLGLYDWDVTLNCSPGKPWQIAEYDTARYGTAGSELAAAMDADDTSLQVITTTGPEWTTSPGDMPFDVLVGGERLTVTAVGERVFDSFTRTVSNGWGTADTGQVWGTLGTPADYSAAAGTGGVISSGSTGTERLITLTAGTPNQSVLVHSNTPVTPTGAPITWGALIRHTDPSNYYWAGVQINTDGTLTLVLRKRVAGVLSTVATAPSATAHSTSVWRILKAEIDGSSIRAKVWDSLSAEPAGWELTATDTSLTTGTKAGCNVRLESGNTNTLPVAVGFDLFTVPQVMTVTRSVNGISKSHSAGAAVALADPAIRAL